jgi:hypothetical protein
MKKIIQYLIFSAIIFGTVAILAGKNASAQTCTNPITSYPTTANGVTIEYYGDASFSPPRTPITCGQSAPPISQFYGNGTTLTAGSYVFSSPVNDIVFWVGGMHDVAAYGAPEKLSWSTNGGNTSVTSSNYCMGILSGSTFTSSGSSSTTGTNTAGGFFTVHADSPFTSVTLIHTQGNSALNGASVLLYYGSVVPSPVLSAVTQPTCTIPTGSFTISNYDPALTYTITPSGTTSSGAVVTVPAGTGPYSVTANNGTCSSGTTESETVNAQPSAGDCCAAEAGTITRQ